MQALIAARLDTLPPERKSLLQDAAVLGKVFWAGALAEMGGRDPARGRAGAARAGPQGARPSGPARARWRARASTRFWHAARPRRRLRARSRGRSGRAATAPRPPGSSSKAGERVEDLAEVLAYHYLQALELAEAAGEPSRRRSSPARLGGSSRSRASGRSASTPPRRSAARPRARALPGRRSRSGPSCSSAGRTPPSRAAARARPRPRSRRRSTSSAPAARARPRGRALILLAPSAHVLGEGRQVALAAEAVDLLEQEPPGPALVAAYAQLATAHFLAGSYDEAIAAADRALRARRELGLPEPARALGARGNARAFLGDPDGLAEMERALALLVEQGAGSASRHSSEQPRDRPLPARGACPLARRLRAGDRLLRAARPRPRWRRAMEADCPGLLVELGRPEEALERAGALAAAIEASGATWMLVWVRALELATHLARGEAEGASGIADWLVEAARIAGDVRRDRRGARAPPPPPDSSPPHPTRRARSSPRSSRRRVPVTSPTTARQLAAMLRTALAAGDPDLARRLADGRRTTLPRLDEHALCAARAQLAEHAGDHAEAATLYAEAAARWQQFGNVPEHAYALLGQGRCLVALADPAAEQPLRQAAELFSSMGYRPALAETEALLEQTTAAAS